MKTQELDDDELNVFLAELGISDHATAELGQLVAPPQLPDNFVVEPPRIDKKKFIWIASAIFAFGLCIGLLIPLPYKNNDGKLTAIQEQIDLLSEKISSYEALTDPPLEVIEPFTFPTPFDSAA